MQLLDPQTGLVVWDASWGVPAPQGGRYIEFDGPTAEMRQPAPRVNAFEQMFNGTGIPERVNALNQTFNPANAMGEAGRQAQVMLDPETSPMGRVGALGGMLTGMSGAVLPMAVAARYGGSAANAVTEAMTGFAPKGNAFLADEFGGMRVYHGTPRQFERFKIGKPSSSGVESPAVWFSNSENVARGYGPNMIEADIDIEDGLDFDFGGGSTVFFDGKHRSPSELAKRIAEINDDLRKGYGLPEGHESDLIYDMMDAGWPEVGGPEAVSGLTLRNVDDSMSMFGGEKSTNYAVFDESLINIVKKYGVAGAAAVLGISAADVEAAMAGQRE